MLNWYEKNVQSEDVGCFEERSGEKELCFWACLTHQTDDFFFEGQASSRTLIYKRAYCKYIRNTTRALAPKIFLAYSHLLLVVEVSMCFLTEKMVCLCIDMKPYEASICKCGGVFG